MNAHKGYVSNELKQFSDRQVEKDAGDYRRQQYRILVQILCA